MSVLQTDHPVRDRRFQKPATPRPPGVEKGLSPAFMGRHVDDLWPICGQGGAQPIARRPAAASREEGRTALAARRTWRRLKGAAVTLFGRDMPPFAPRRRVDLRSAALLPAQENARRGRASGASSPRKGRSVSSRPGGCGGDGRLQTVQSQRTSFFNPIVRSRTSTREDTAHARRARAQRASPAHRSGERPGCTGASSHEPHGHPRRRRSNYSAADAASGLFASEHPRVPYLLHRVGALETCRK